MTKRLIALFLVCILAIPIFVVPASATSTQEVTLSDADIGFFDDWYSYIDEGIGVCADYLSQLLYQVKSFVTVTVPAWTAKFNEFVTQEFEQGLHDELGEWLGTMGADMRDGLLVIGTACVDIYEYLVNVIFESIALIEETLIDFAQLVDEWFEGCYDYLGLIYKSLNGTDEDKAAADDFQNQIATESTEMQEALDQIQQATIPDYEGIDTDFENYTADSNRYSAIIKAVFASSSIKSVFVLAFTFAMLTYIFFGKR